MWVALGPLSSSLHGKSGLARAAGAGQRQYGVIALQEHEHLVEFAPSTKKRCLRNWQVRLVECLERRECLPRELQDALARRGL